MRIEACVLVSLLFVVPTGGTPFNDDCLQPSPLWPYPIGGATRTLEPQGRVRVRGVALDRASPLAW